MLDLQSALAGLLGNARPVVNQQSPRNSALAKALMSQSMQGNIETPMELMGRLGQFWAGNKVENDRLAQEKLKNDDLVKALVGAGDDNGAIASTLIQSGDPDLMKMGIQLRTAKGQPQDSWGDTFDLPGGGLGQKNARTGKIDVLVQPKKPGEGGGPYAGNAMDAQNWNVILQGDPSSPQYEAAYTQLFETPQLRQVQTDQGLQFIPVMPTVPSFVAKPAGRMASGTGGSAPAAPATAPSAPTAPSPAPSAPAQGTAPTGGVQQPILIPGTAPKPTEQQIRNHQLASVIDPELKTVEDNFGELAKLGNQGAGAVPVAGNFAVSEGYQQARGALKTIIQSYLYSVSGATANPGEVENQIDVLTPKPGDADSVVQQKLARVRAMVAAVKEAGRLPGEAKPDAAAPATSQNGVVDYKTYFKEP